MTLVGGFDFNIWTTWTIANSAEAVQTSRDDKIYQYGNTVREDVQKLKIASIADPTLMTAGGVFL